MDVCHNIKMKTITDYLLSKQESFRGILARAGQLEQWQQLFKIALIETGKNFSPNDYHVVAIEKTALVILTHNASFATRLRFETDHVLLQLNQFAEFKHIQTIHIKIRSMTARPQASQPVYPPMPKLSQTTAQRLNEIAETIEESALKRALKRLAQKTS